MPSNDDTVQRLTLVSHNTTCYACNATHVPHGAVASAVYGLSNNFQGLNAAYTYNSRLQPYTMRAGGADIDL